MINQTISDEDNDIRLDRWFKRHFPNLQHAMLEKYLRKGAVRLDGKKAKSSDRIRAGQVLGYPEFGEDVAFVKAKPQASEQDAEFVRSLVLYKDANVIIINKPFGLPVQGGTKIKKSLDDMLGGLLFDAKERPKLVHRLDRDTSGVLVLARNTKSASLLAKMFAGKDIEKTYLALTHGRPLQTVGTIDYRLLKAEHGENSYERVAVDDEEGKYARTEYRVVESLARRFALMELKPLTGRTHQLRVHMQAINCPIVGDEKYGGDELQAQDVGIADGLHLHARRIVIPAFGSGKKIDVTAPLPTHMKESFKALGIEVKK
ncbi:MAG: RluA family pseudouridine synthase [Pseudomonadota bacterium]